MGPPLIGCRWIIVVVEKGQVVEPCGAPSLIIMIIYIYLGNSFEYAKVVLTCI